MIQDLFTQPPEPTGAELKGLGIQKAVEHADEVVEQWSTKAYKQFLEYMAMVTEFKTEDVRRYAEQNGFEMPPSKRAWGAIALRVARAGLIIKNGHVKTDNPKAHQAFVTLWQVVR